MFLTRTLAITAMATLASCQNSSRKSFSLALLIPIPSSSAAEIDFYNSPPLHPPAVSPRLHIVDRMAPGPAATHGRRPGGSRA